MKILVIREPWELHEEAIEDRDSNGEVLGPIGRSHSLKLGDVEEERDREVLKKQWGEVPPVYDIQIDMQCQCHCTCHMIKRRCKGDS